MHIIICAHHNSFLVIKTWFNDFNLNHFTLLSLAIYFIHLTFGSCLSGQRDVIKSMPPRANISIHFLGVMQNPIYCANNTTRSKCIQPLWSHFIYPSIENDVHAILLRFPANKVKKNKRNSCFRGWR